MTFQALAEYKRIISIFRDTLVHVVMEYLIHFHLKCSWCIECSHRRNKVLKLTIFRIESRVLNVVGFHLNLMEIRFEISFWKLQGSSSFIKRLISYRYRSIVFHRYFVQENVANNTFPLIAFPQSEQWGSIRRLTFSDFSHFLQVFNVLFGSSLFCRELPIQRVITWFWNFSISIAWSTTPFGTHPPG